jgi:hypothetical protein
VPTWHDAGVPDERAPPTRDEPDDLIQRQQDEITRLPEEVARSERANED